MRVLSAQEIQSVSGAATTSTSTVSFVDGLRVVLNVLAVSLYLLLTGKKFTDLI